MRNAILVALLAVSLLGCAAPRCGADACRNDARIAAEVRAQIARHVELAAPNQVDIQVIDGVVYLRGLVSTPYQQGLAAELAGEAHGVVRVVNEVALDNSR
jgi:osmotically-inducible protein OsmY